MPSAMNMDMNNMSSQFGNLMMPSQMGFQGQGMYMDPNINMQMLMSN
jgi:hypothetical protein